MKHVLALIVGVLGIIAGYPAEAAKYIEPSPLILTELNCHDESCPVYKTPIFEVHGQQTITFGLGVFGEAYTDQHFDNCGGQSGYCQVLYGKAVARFIFSEADENISDWDLPIPFQIVSCDPIPVGDPENPDYYDYACPSALYEMLTYKTPKGAYGVQLIVGAAQFVAPPISSIPVPAGLPLLASGGVLLGLMRWRQRRAA